MTHRKIALAGRCTDCGREVRLEFTIGEAARAGEALAALAHECVSRMVAEIIEESRNEVHLHPAPPAAGLPPRLAPPVGRPEEGTRP